MNPDIPEQIATVHVEQLIAGRSMNALTDRGNNVRVWKADGWADGSTDRNHYFCHGFSFDTARWGYSPFGSAVETILTDEYDAVDPSNAAAGDIVVYRHETADRLNDRSRPQHTCRLLTVAHDLQPAIGHQPPERRINLATTRAVTKNGPGVELCVQNLRSLAAFYGTILSYYRQRIAPANRLRPIADLNPDRQQARLVLPDPAPDDSGCCVIM